MRVSAAPRLSSSGDAPSSPPPPREQLVNPDPNARPIRAPAATKGLALPSAATPGVIPRAIVTLGDLSILSHLSGSYFDAAFLAALELKWRSLKTDLGKLSPGDTDRLAREVVRSLQARGRMRDDATAQIAAYTVRLVVDKYAKAGVNAPSAPKTKAAEQAITPQIEVPAMANNDETIKQLRALMPGENDEQAERDARALKAQRIVDRRVRYLIAHEPTRVDAFVRQLATLGVPVARLPVSFRNGWSIAVADGKTQGTIPTAEPFTAQRFFGQRYRAGLRDVSTRSLELLPRPVDVTYTFVDATRTLSAAEYARILVSQHAFVMQPGWPNKGDPFDLATVRGYFQHVCDSGAPMGEVFAQWQTYLSAFYTHASSADLEGPAGAMGLNLYDTGRLTKDMQGVVDDLLPATTGQRLLDCEFFAGLTHDVFGHITKDGKPRFDAYWIALDTHEAQLIVERGPGPHAWALSNNDQIGVQGTTSGAVDEAILTSVGKHILWGAPAIFATSTDHDKADKAEHSPIGLPSVGAYVYDGAKLSRVTETDRRAFLIYVATRSHPLQTRYGDFVESWRR